MLTLFFKDDADIHNSYGTGNYGSTTNFSVPDSVIKWACAHDIIYDSVFQVMYAPNESPAYHPSSFMNTAQQENIDIMLALYMPFASVYHNPVYEEETNTFWSQWAKQMVQYAARTNKTDPATSLPDTFAVWKRNYNLNLLQPGCIEDAVTLMLDYFNSSPVLQNYNGKVIFMFDFIAVPYLNLKVAGSNYALEENGEVDLDEDSIGFFSDYDEQLAYYNKIIEYLQAIDSAFPDRVLFIANGKSAYNNVVINGQTYPKFSEYLDGAFYEGFPLYFFGNGESINWTNVLNPDYEFSLINNYSTYRTTRGGPLFLMDCMTYSTGSYLVTINELICHMFDNMYISVITTPSRGLQFDGNTFNGINFKTELNKLGRRLAPVPTILEDGTVIANYENGFIKMRLLLGYGINAYRYIVQLYDGTTLLENQWVD